MGSREKEKKREITERNIVPLDVGAQEPPGERKRKRKRKRVSESEREREREGDGPSNAAVATSAAATTAITPFFIPYLALLLHHLRHLGFHCDAGRRRRRRRQRRRHRHRRREPLTQFSGKHPNLLLMDF